MSRIIHTLLLMVSISLSLFASESRVGIVFWDVSPLYDTIPSPNYHDDDFTPSGKRSWGSDRYNRKVENIAAVIDSLRVPIVVLYGVESKGVVRDILTASSEDYSSIHRERNSFDGLDFALLYYGDILFIDRVTQRRDMLIIEAEAMDKPITIVATLSGRYLDELSHITPESRVILVGKYSIEDLGDLPLDDLLTGSESRGYGNVATQRGWTLEDRVAVSEGLEPQLSGIYIKEWLLNSDRVAPLATFDGRRYLGGYASHLPIFLFFH